MPTWTSKDIHNYIDIKKFDIVFDSILKGDTSIGALFSGIGSVIHTGSFNSEIFVELRRFIDTAPQFKEMVLEELITFNRTMLSYGNITYRSYTLDDFLDVYPYRLDVVQRLLHNVTIVEPHDRIVVEDLVLNMTAAAPLLKVEWQNLNTSERMLALYAHVLNFNNVFPNGGSMAEHVAASVCSIQCASGVDRFSLTYDQVIPLLHSYYSDIIPEHFFKQLNEVSTIIGGFQFIDLPTLCHIYESSVLTSNDANVKIDFEFID